MQRSLSLSDLSSDAGIGSRSVSSLSLTSDDGIDETDTQRVSRDKMERELMIAYSRRRPLIRPLDLSQATSRPTIVKPFFFLAWDCCLVTTSTGSD